jgi:Rrf2 family iron-sulfur cluster assembly transcriptional regulator
MVKLSNKARYGVRAMFDIAFHGEGVSAQIKDIAERQGIPPRFLEQIFQDLRKASLVSSKRGPRGGYQLVSAPNQVSVGDILRALEGPIALCAADEEGEGVGDAASGAVIDGAFRELSERVEACFNALTLEELCDRAQRQGLQKNAPAGYVYVI